MSVRVGIACWLLFSFLFCVAPAHATDVEDFHEEVCTETVAMLDILIDLRDQAHLTQERAFARMQRMLVNKRFSITEWADFSERQRQLVADLVHKVYESDIQREQLEQIYSYCMDNVETWIKEEY